MSSGSGPASWREMLEKTVELGLGAALLTKDAAAKLVEDLVKRGKISKEEGSRLVSEMLEKGKGQKAKIEQLIAESVERVLTKADLARRSSVEELERRVAALEEELGRKRGG
jgi:polyhydroxyalkanoate synthesis regulator phasin